MYENIKDKLPEYICRKDVSKILSPYFGHVYSHKYLQNLDFRGQGPKKVRIGRKIFYQRDDFLNWLEKRSIVS